MDKDKHQYSITEAINVTKTFLPPQEEYLSYLNKAWQKGWLTNNGELVRELEEKLKEYLKIEELFYVSNGTIALQIAIKALELSGEIITTPFSYVATTTSIMWENCTPVFADIDEHSLNIDPASIEAAITPKTSAILATHVFGNPCDIEAIESIAKRYKLKVIYDAAHCFGVKYKDKSIFKFGDISIASFHATKVFHTVEGGALFTSNPLLAEKIRYMRNFGHNGPGQFAGIGINGKNTEFHAAMGLCNLKYIEKIIAERKKITEFYDQQFKEENKLHRPRISKDIQYNYAYYPVIFESETRLLHIEDKLNKENIYPRRYFYPSLNKLPYIKKQQDCPVSEDVARRILCLPLFVGLTEASIQTITKIVNI